MDFECRVVVFLQSRFGEFRWFFTAVDFGGSLFFDSIQYKFLHIKGFIGFPVRF